MKSFKYRGYRWDCTTVDGVTTATQRNGINSVQSTKEAEIKKQIDELSAAGKLRNNQKKDAPKVWKPKLDYEKIKAHLIATKAVEAVESVIHYAWDNDRSVLITYVVEWGMREYQPGKVAKVPLITKQIVLRGNIAINACKMDFSAEKVDKAAEVA